ECGVGPDENIILQGHPIPKLNPGLDRHSVSHHDVIFDEYPITDIAITPDLRIRKNVSKCPDPAALAYLLAFAHRDRMDENSRMMNGGGGGHIISRWFWIQ